MKRAFLLPGLLGLAACAPPGGGGSVGALPKPEAPPPAPLEVASVEGGVIRVTGFARNEDALEAHHCLAAKRARGEGAGALQWVGGVAQREEGDAVTADLVYQTAAAAARPTGAPPAEGRAAPVADWLIYCDEAGLPREGEA